MDEGLLGEIPGRRSRCGAKLMSEILRRKTDRSPTINRMKRQSGLSRTGNATDYDEALSCHCRLTTVKLAFSSLVTPRDGALPWRARSLKAKPLGGFAIDGQRDIGQRHNRDICDGIGAIENLARDDGRLFIGFRQACSVARIAAFVFEFVPLVHRRDAIAFLGGDYVLTEKI